MEEIVKVEITDMVYSKTSFRRKFFPFHLKGNFLLSIQESLLKNKGRILKLYCAMFMLQVDRMA